MLAVAVPKTICYTIESSERLMYKRSEHVHFLFSLRDCFHEEQEFEDLWLDYSKAPGRIIAVDLKARRFVCCLGQENNSSNKKQETLDIF